MYTSLPILKSARRSHEIYTERMQEKYTGRGLRVNLIIDDSLIMKVSGLYPSQLIISSVVTKIIDGVRFKIHWCRSIT